MGIVFLSLGSNLGNRKIILEKAIGVLGKEAGEITAVSSLYETEPWGFLHENYFYNLVLKMDTDLDPEKLFSVLRKVEDNSGRIRKTGDYEARILDIDILFYEDMIYQTNKLIIPHPRLHERLFVLIPMAEIAGDFIHPVLKKSIKQLLGICGDNKKVIKAGRISL